MSSPFPIVDVNASAYSVLETRTELVANGSVKSGFVDVIDMLPVRNNSAGGGYTYSREQMAMDSRHVLLWSIYAEGLGGIPAPGELMIEGANLDPASIGNMLVETYVIKRIVIPGPAFQFSISTLITKTMHTGQLVCTQRAIRVWYLNGSVAQTRFSCGVFLRTLA